jgi:FkbM family methyltransferase
VEVGAYDGECVSNTCFLADEGWKGLYIEPTTDIYNKCLKRHVDNDVVVVNVSIGLEEGTQTIYSGDTLSTLREDQMQRYNEIDVFQHVSFQEDTCTQVRLDNLINKLTVPKNFDLLVVDVEGKESEVFKTFKLNEWKPKMLIVELEDEHPKFQQYTDLIEEIKELRQYINSNGYIEIFKDHINTVFVRSELLK